MIERRPAVISSQEDRQTDSEIKVTGKEQFRRGGLSCRWMCNMGGGGGGGAVAAGGQEYLLCEMSARRALCRFRADGLSPVTWRSSAAVETSNMHPDEAWRQQSETGPSGKSGKKRKRKCPPRWDCGITAVSPLNHKGRLMRSRSLGLAMKSRERLGSADSHTWS